MLTSKLLGSFIVLLIISMTALPLMNTVFAQTPSNTLQFSTKGAVAESSNFHGAIMWTIINGDQGTIIIQSPAGRGLAHVSISQSTACTISAPICLLSTVTDAGQIAAFKVGDTARFAVDLNANQQTVSILSGTLAGFDVSVNLSKIWNKNPISTTSVTPPVNSTVTTPVTTPPATNSTVSTVTNSTTVPTYIPKHFSLNLNESISIQSHG